MSPLLLTYRRVLCPRSPSLAEGVTLCRSWIQIRRVFAHWDQKPDKEGSKCGDTLCHPFYLSQTGKNIIQKNPNKMAKNYI